jgi:PadR family transcriptional regulator PadR
MLIQRRLETQRELGPEIRPENGLVVKNCFLYEPQKSPVAFQKEACHYSCWKPKGSFAMKEKPDVLQGTLALMVLKTLDVLGQQHGWGIARRIEQISGDLLAVNQGTLYPLLLKLEHEGSIASEWGASENNRRARFYRLTGAGRKQLQAETREWEQTAAIIGRFFIRLSNLATGRNADQRLQDEIAEHSLPFFENLLFDLRYAVRVLLRSPGFSFVAIATMALGIGATTPIYSVIDATLPHPLPYPNPAELVRIQDGQAPVIDGPIVSPEHFHLLGMALFRGRLFSNQDLEDTPQVAVINQAAALTYWPNQDRRCDCGCPHGIVGGRGNSADLPQRVPAPGQRFGHLSSRTTRSQRRFHTSARAGQVHRSETSGLPCGDAGGSALHLGFG